MLESGKIIFVPLLWILITGLQALPLESNTSLPDLTTSTEPTTPHPTLILEDGHLISNPPHLRVKRFPIPTTYPVPTKPGVTLKPDQQTVLTGSALFLNSRPVNCPVKRSARRKRIVLSQDIMRELYLHLVGDYDKTLLAETFEEAERDFIHLPYSPNATSPNDKSFYKEIREDTAKLDRWITAVMASINVSAENDPSGIEVGNITLEYILQKVDITKTKLKQLLSIKNNIDLVTSYHSGNQRGKRAATTSATPQGRFCVQRGSKTSDGFLHLCTTCAFITQLPGDRYPQYINEAGCDKSDCNCFIVNGHHHGKCKAVVHHVKMLRRKKNGCRLMIQDGNQFVLHDWELYDQPVNVGCECVMNKNSQYAILV